MKIWSKNNQEKMSLLKSKKHNEPKKKKMANLVTPFCFSNNHRNFLLEFSHNQLSNFSRNDEIFCHSFSKFYSFSFKLLEMALRLLGVIKKGSNAYSNLNGF